MEKHDQAAAKALLDSGVKYNEDGILNDKLEDVLVRLLYDIKEQIDMAEAENKKILKLKSKITPNKRICELLPPLD